MGIGALRGSESEIDYQKSRKWIDSDTGGEGWRGEWWRPVEKRH